MDGGTAPLHPALSRALRARAMRITASHTEKQTHPGVDLTQLSPLTCHLSPVTCHLSPVTCHLSPVTCHLSPVTCHLSPVTCHLSPVTCHLMFHSWAFQVWSAMPRRPPTLTSRSLIRTGSESW